MASRALITLGYILGFWGLLPGALAALTIWGQRLFGPHLRLSALRVPGIVLALVAGIMLAVSIVQYTKASGNLPISAFPPRKIIRSGVFGIWRHPIYLFSVLFYGGFGLALWPAGLLVAGLPILVLGTVLYSRFEERGLEKRFGALYQGHRSQTSILVPRLHHVLRLVAAPVCRIFFRLRVSGRENARLDPPFFVISAHRNYLDCTFITLALGLPVHFITTSEQFRSLVSRAFFTRLHAMPKKRYAPDVHHALDIRRRLAQGCVIGVFPEAERSWTGAMVPLKPAALKLLRRCPAIPILPVRLQGAYESWPRWAPRPSRGRVVASIGSPIYPAEEESPQAFEARIRALMDPPRASQSPSRAVSAKGIEALIYRCPECSSFDAIRSGSDGSFSCTTCQARFVLQSGRTVRKIGQDVALPLERFAERIFVPFRSAAAFEPLDRAFRAGGVMLSVERQGRLEEMGKGRLELGKAGLDFFGASGNVRFDLAALKAVVVEGVRIVQIYCGRPPVLSRFTFADQSVLKWHHLIAGAVLTVRGKLPDTA